MLAESLKGKSVIVTGASKGIGKGIGRVFARHGAKVLVVARDLQAAEATAREFVAAGGTASGFSADVTRLEDMEKMARTAAERHGGLDVLCANAGIFPQVKMEDIRPDAHRGWRSGPPRIAGRVEADVGPRPAEFPPPRPGHTGGDREMPPGKNRLGSAFSLNEIHAPPS
ncbi:SDR family NAD(P)-dependent oxidoreductase [Archangium violaceum]|uniref:SDR family NAD(P)-dependent oxidoreductase n=1 Tax=Archangium violaceum TaxID=83451 RepID=UPI00069756E6|nr:SDR family NAD(P)-dependent oxidoreductase [Archangium violaceum]